MWFWRGLCRVPRLTRLSQSTTHGRFGRIGIIWSIPRIFRQIAARWTWHRHKRSSRRMPLCRPKMPMAGLSMPAVPWPLPRHIGRCTRYVRALSLIWVAIWSTLPLAPHISTAPAPLIRFATIFLCAWTGSKPVGLSPCRTCRSAVPAAADFQQSGSRRRPTGGGDVGIYGPLGPLLGRGVAVRSGRFGPDRHVMAPRRRAQIRPSLWKSCLRSASGRAPKWVITSVAAMHPIRPAVASVWPVAIP
jgi:hypothetical protein